MVRDQLARIGVAVDVVPVAPERFVADVLMTGALGLPGRLCGARGLANWGAKGFGDWDYVRVGYRR
ncbi:hypothetical protein ACVGVM_21335 [Pseudonocardia bannensis]|uniref:Uncharacterized protein n=1 Tax=Pseudonocardia bannensis TaxID=630973 RepID=A0A848DJY8_9PSEU|nr:hypothetical protein [Pseudonocardia bannensis]NMH92859.1 hypothetical protein [Pseudonocardia bannensis]